MKIVICRSNRFHKQALDFARELEHLGHIVHYPPRVSGTAAWNRMSKSEKLVAVRKLVDDHFKAIDDAEIVLVFNVAGYIGVSVNIEIGYAVAKNKRIFVTCPDTDMPRAILYEGIAETPAMLRDILQEQH